MNLGLNKNLVFMKRLSDPDEKRTSLEVNFGPDECVGDEYRL